MYPDIRVLVIMGKFTLYDHHIPGNPGGDGEYALYTNCWHEMWVSLVRANPE